MLRKYQKKVCPSVCLNPFALAGMREILKLGLGLGSGRVRNFSLGGQVKF